TPPVAVRPSPSTTSCGCCSGPPIGPTAPPGRTRPRPPPADGGTPGRRYVWLARASDSLLRWLRMSDGNTAAQWVPTGSVTVRVPGKVNLYLAVGDRREDGYHELTTIFQAVSLLDELTVRNADVLSLEIVGE